MARAAPSAPRPHYLLRLGRAHWRLIVCALIGAVTVALVPGPIVTRLLFGWDLGAFLYIGAAWIVMARCNSTEGMKHNAAAQDEGKFGLLVLTAAAALASLGAIFAELGRLEKDDPAYGFTAALAVTTVMLSWTFIQTIFALYYAHAYHGGRRNGGLDFPGDEEPDYWDFFYFAVVIGMTFQVSDVGITQKPIRRMVTAHGVLSFFFTTTVVAMMVNIAAGVIQK